VTHNRVDAAAVLAQRAMNIVQDRGENKEIYVAPITVLGLFDALLEDSTANMILHRDVGARHRDFCFFFYEREITEVAHAGIPS
jgi:hypothetical protein